MKSNGSLAYGLFLIIGDFIALLAAFSGGYILRVSVSHRPISENIHASTYLEIFLILLPFWIMLFGLLGLYSSSIYEKRFTEAARLLIGSFIGLLSVTSLAYFDRRPIFPAHLVPVYGFILAFLFLLIFRNGARALRAKLFDYGIGITNILIVGNTRVARELVESLANYRTSGYRIVGIVGAKEHTTEKYPHLRIFKTFKEAMAKLKTDDIHSIVQTELYAAGEANNEVLEFAQAHHIAYRFIPGNSELFVGNIEVELFRSSVPVIAVHQTALIGWGRIAKRLTDLIFGTVFLIIALPFMLLVAILIKVFDFRGPLLHKDLRFTRFGNTASIYKFRSMKQAYSGLTPEEAFTKMGRPELIKRYRQNGDFLADDPRLSRVGRYLRRTSLDELPQLVNIVNGDISLVGPRALQTAELEKYTNKDLILSVKSGLTGLAQISGRREISFEERRRLDMYYVQNWSIWMDFMIIIKTFRVLFSRIGAR
ncbi:MAG TPA: sugar transferase [Candidatus Nitrosopolaris sp.]|nr:sugar transferase [Candidatus Nitrosopolaris sp.]